MYNFQLINLDTDSVTVCKQDGAPFSQEEQTRILQELNASMPEKISWEDDGYFSRVVIVAAKNYILKSPDGKIKVKGNSLKAPMKAKALQEFIKGLVDLLLEERQSEAVALYHKYVKEIHNITEISRWSVKKTYTEKVDNSERTNESKIKDALEGSEYTVGDKLYLYYKVDGTLNLQEHWNNDHDPIKLLKNLFDTVKTFDTVLDMTQFQNYALKSHPVKVKLAQVLGLPEPVKVKTPRKPKPVAVSFSLGMDNPNEPD